VGQNKCFHCLFTFSYHQIVLVCLPTSINFFPIIQIALTSISCSKEIALLHLRKILHHSFVLHLGSCYKILHNFFVSFTLQSWIIVVWDLNPLWCFHVLAATDCDSGPLVSPFQYTRLMIYNFSCKENSSSSNFCCFLSRLDIYTNIWRDHYQVIFFSVLSPQTRLSNRVN
jgi:hypothetical protein